MAEYASLFRPTPTLIPIPSRDQMATILYLTHIEFGRGSRKLLDDQVTSIGVTRPFVISDHGIAASGLLERVTRRLTPHTPSFLDVPPNPTEAAVLAAAEAYKAAGANGIVALGGGSPIDLAKGVALLATHEGPLAQYAAILGGVAFTGGAGQSTNLYGAILAGDDVSATNQAQTDTFGGSIKTRHARQAASR